MLFNRPVRDDERMKTDLSPLQVEELMTIIRSYDDDDLGNIPDRDIELYQAMTYYPIGVCWLVYAKTNGISAREYQADNGVFKYSVAVLKCEDGYRVGVDAFYITKRAFKTEESALSWWNSCKHNIMKLKPRRRV